ncbi:MAG: aldo/keto reductase [Deltaproteobacteria bacterium]|nr:aldo/keto reductase [Deltaproteobacteria bacterium]
MKYQNLGQSGLEVSRLCLGTMTFGEADDKSFMHQVGCDEATSFAIMNRALDAGINFFDTADVYGQDGLTEKVIGRWFAKEQRRDQVVLATKFRFRMKDGPNGTGASRYRIMKTVEDSLRRLQTDRIDLYQIHMQDVATPEEETLRALDDLVHQGKVLYLGCSNYAAYRMVESLFISARERLHRFIALQAQYSLIVRELEREHVPACQKFGVSLLPWSPLAGGFLSGKYQKGQTAPTGTRLDKWKDRYQRFDLPRNWKVLDALQEVSKQLEATPSQVALAWLLHKPTVASVIFGARTVQQLDDNLRAVELVLSKEQLSALDEASSYELGYPYDFMARIQKSW